jgi:hypothetical protein
MAIIRTASATYPAPISFKCLSESGQLDELKFDVRFKRLKQSENDALHRENIERARAIRDQIEKDGSIDDIQAQAKQAGQDRLRKYATGWNGVQNEDKSDVPFSFDALFELCEEYPGLLNAINEAFAKSVTPEAAAHFATKN